MELLLELFPITEKTVSELEQFSIEGDLKKVSERFSAEKPSASPFENSGVMIDREVYTVKTAPDYKGKRILLKDVVEHDEAKIPAEFYIKDSDLKQWKYLKGGKKEEKVEEWLQYHYSEGPMVFPDPLKPSRTIVTGEGGSSPSRFQACHQDQVWTIASLDAGELERLNMFQITTLQGYGGVRWHLTRSEPLS